MEIFFGVILASIFLYINFLIIKKDIQEKIIPNKYLGYLLLLLPLWYTYFLYFHDILPITFWISLFQLWIWFLLSFWLYNFKIWGAGDAKYLLVLFLYFPQDLLIFICNITLIIISYFIIDFIIYYIKHLNTKSLIMLISNFKKIVYDNIYYHKNRDILFQLVYFFIWFIIFRIFRIEFFQTESFKNIYYYFQIQILIIIVILWFVWFIFLKRYMYKKLNKYLSRKNIIQTNQIKIIKYTSIWIWCIILFLIYIIDKESFFEDIKKIISIYIFIYLFIRFLIFTIKYYFWNTHVNTVYLTELKNWDIIDYYHLYTHYGENTRLWFVQKDERDKIKNTGPLYPDPRIFFKSLRWPLNNQQIKKLTNSLHQIWVNEIKKQEVFSFAPYIFLWFWIYILLGDFIIKYSIDRIITFILRG